MRQDTDVARMAAALRTPSLKYRSFGNEAVRNPLPPSPPAAEDQAFSILGDALAGASDLPADTVLGDPAPVPTETPMLPARESYRSHAESPPVGAEPVSRPVAPDPYAEIERVPAPVVPPLPAEPAQPPATPAASTFAVPVVPAPVVPARPAPEPEGSSLLQILLGGQAQQPVAAPTPSPVPPAVMAPVAAAPAIVTPVVPAPVAPAPVSSAPVLPTPAFPALVPAPIGPRVADVPMLSTLSAVSSWSPPRGGTGSSLLDTLMGVGVAAGAPAIHYPLLDALGDAMRGSVSEPSPRLWPAARVDIALPELLRRVAAGVRFARPAA